MNAIDIYEDIKNPLDNQGFIKNIFTGYLKTNNFDEFSDYIKRFSETKNFTLETNIIGEEAHKKFISFMFNIWKNNVINTKIELIPKNKYNINKLLETKELLQDITDLDYIEKIYNTKEDISWYRMDTYYTYISYNICYFSNEFHNWCFSLIILAMLKIHFCMSYLGTVSILPFFDVLIGGRGYSSYY